MCIDEHTRTTHTAMQMGDTETNWHIIDWHVSIRKPNHLLKLILISTVDIPFVFRATVSLVTCSDLYAGVWTAVTKRKNQWTPTKPYVSHRVQYPNGKRCVIYMLPSLFVFLFFALRGACTIISHFVALSTVNWYMKAPKWCVYDTPNTHRINDINACTL